MSRTADVHRWIDQQHFRYSVSGVSTPPGHIRIANLRLGTRFEPGRTFTTGRRQFVRFLKECLGISVDLPTAGIDLVFEPEPSHPLSGFQAGIFPDRIHICAAGERGFVEAMHYLEREMADRRGPWLPLGMISRFPSLQTRFSEGIFIPGHQDANHLGDFAEDYLGLMSHFGANALKINFTINDWWRSRSLPELNTPDFDAACEKIRHHAARLADHGLDFFIVLNASSLPAIHPVFQSHPEVRGAQEEVFLEELSGADRCVLCSGHPLVLKAYGEVLTALARAVPELAGVVVAVGGEGFRHCFTRPNVSCGQSTNCMRCRESDPHAHVAVLVNTLAAALKRAAPEKRLLAWPYSAFVWSQDDPTDSRWIQHLDPAVEVLSNFDCGDPDPTIDSGAYLFDYNIKVAGPSSRFAAQAARCRPQGNPILAKTETNTTPDTFFLPYLPVYFRWYDRFRAIRESGASGFMGQWRFYGMNGSLPEELQYHAVFNPDRTAEDLLGTAARRDFGLKAAESERAVEGWRKLSEAWDWFPYSAMTAGEREAYLRGPWYLGPAHPLIFDEQSSYDLGERFFERRGDLPESLSADQIRLLPGKPRYVCNLLLCLPFGVDSFLEHARKCRDRWDEGLAELEAVLSSVARAEAVRELNVCRTISIHLHTLVNTVEFHRLRDRLGTLPQDLPAFQKILAELDRRLALEIENARRAIPILETDPRIGYGHAYGEVYDAEMVSDKIRQCEFVRKHELPRIGSVIRFHVWQKYP